MLIDGHCKRERLRELRKLEICKPGLVGLQLGEVGEYEGDVGL